MDATQQLRSLLAQQADRERKQRFAEQLARKVERNRPANVRAMHAVATAAVKAESHR